MENQRDIIFSIGTYLKRKTNFRSTTKTINENLITSYDSNLTQYILYGTGFLDEATQALLFSLTKKFIYKKPPEKNNQKTEKFCIGFVNMFFLNLIYSRCLKIYSKS